MSDTRTDPLLPAPALMHRVSWGAIFAGAISAIALTALLSLLGLGIGLGSFDPAQGDSAAGVPKMTLLWWAVVSILATGIGGFIAARLAGIPRSLTGALHGLAVWSVATIVTLWLATTAVGFALGAASSVVSTTARVASGAVTTVGGAAVGAGQAAMPSAEQVAPARDRVIAEALALGQAAGVDRRDAREAQNALAATARDIARTPGDMSADLSQLIDRLFQGPQAALSPAERERLVDEIARRSGVSREEAQQIAARWQTQAEAGIAQVRTQGGEVIQQAGTTAANVSNQALDLMAMAAWGMFLISLAGLVAAVIGAALGAPSLASVAATIGHDRHHDDRDDRHDRHDRHE